MTRRGGRGRQRVNRFLRRGEVSRRGALSVEHARGGHERQARQAHRETQIERHRRLPPLLFERELLRLLLPRLLAARSDLPLE